MCAPRGRGTCPGEQGRCCPRAGPGHGALGPLRDAVTHPVSPPAAGGKVLWQRLQQDARKAVCRGVGCAARGSSALLPAGGGVRMRPWVLVKLEVVPGNLWYKQERAALC